MRALGLLLLVLGAQGAVLSSVEAQGNGEIVYLIEVKGEIDLGLTPYVKRVLREAEKAGAEAAVVEINTLGGRLDAALDIKNALLESKVRTIAFVNREAFSAGALIAIATEVIYMALGAVLGAATPVLGDTGVTASEKVVSAVRKDFKSVAEARGLDPTVAEAMVDEDVEVPDLVEKGKLLTLTTDEALRWGYAKGEVEDLEELLEQEGLAGHELVRTSPGLAERLVRFITNPAVASLLISLGFLGLFFELQSPSFGLSGAMGALFLALFFWGHFLAGLAGLEGVVLVIVGIILLALEMLVVPGFGIAGILGIIAFLTGLFLTMVGRVPTAGDYERSLIVVIAALLLMLTGAYLSLRFLPKRSLGGLVLQTRLVGATGAAGDTPRTGPLRGRRRSSLEGAQGTTLTPLRPAGIALIQGQRIDVVTEGDFIPEGAGIEVVLDEGYRRVVRPLPPAGEAGTPETS